MRISDWSSDVCSSDLIWCTRDLLTHWGAAEIISTTPEEVRSDLSDEDGVLSDHCMERIARARRILQQDEDRKSVVEGKSVSVRVDLGGRRIIQKKKAREINT